MDDEQEWHIPADSFEEEVIEEEMVPEDSHEETTEEEREAALAIQVEQENAQAPA